MNQSEGIVDPLDVIKFKAVLFYKTSQCGVLV